MPAETNNVCVTITTGRSGSTFLQNVFRRNYPESRGILHESLHPGKAKPARFHRDYSAAALADPAVRAHLDGWDGLLQSGPVVDFGWVLGLLAPALRQRYGERLKVLTLTAHPVSVAASFANRGHYAVNRNREWAIDPFRETARFPQYCARWERMSAFERGLYRWLEITSFGVEYTQVLPAADSLSFRSSELFKDPQRIRRIAGLIGFADQELSLEVDRNESLDFHVERRPLREEWRRVYDMPEVMELAISMGFDMEEASLRQLVRRYQLQGLIPRLRHATRYWALREALGRLR